MEHGRTAQGIVGEINAASNGEHALDRFRLAALTAEQLAQVYDLALAQVEAKAVEAWINLLLEPGDAVRRALYRQLVEQRDMLMRDRRGWDSQ